jgi:hypothetical protein
MMMCTMLQRGNRAADAIGAAIEVLGVDRRGFAVAKPVGLLEGSNAKIPRASPPPEIGNTFAPDF